MSGDLSNISWFDPVLCFAELPLGVFYPSNSKHLLQFIFCSFHVHVQDQEGN